jgi:hypothetical protein
MSTVTVEAEPFSGAYRADPMHSSYGAALASGCLADRTGCFGRVTQTLVIDWPQQNHNGKDHHAGFST